LVVILSGCSALVPAQIKGTCANIERAANTAVADAAAGRPEDAIAILPGLAAEAKALCDWMYPSRLKATPK
jgi:hypothetical protein